MTEGKDYLNGQGAGNWGGVPQDEAELNRLFATRLQAGLTRRLYPNSPLRRRDLASRVGRHSQTFRPQAQSGGFSMPLLARIDAELAREGLPGLYDEVVGRAGQPRGPWRVERLNLDDLGDRLRGALLAEVRLGHSPLEVAAQMGLLNEITVLQLAGGEFFSVQVGEALPVDRSVQGKPVRQRSDANYAALIEAHLFEAARSGPTLYRLDGGSIVYERLALPGADGLVITVPFNRQVAPGLKIA